MPAMSWLGATLTAAAILTTAPAAVSAAPAATVHSPPARAAALDTAGLAVLANNTIIRADGRVIRLGLPRGATAISAAQVPSGWLVSAGEPNRTGALWFFSNAGSPHRIGPVRGNWAVSSDGGLLVVTGLGAGTDAVSGVVAMDLPSLRVRARTRFTGATGPLVVGITTDRVVLRQAQGSPGPSIAAVWNLRTGSLRATSSPIWVWSADDGQALTRVDQRGAGNRPGGACVDAVAVTDRLPVGRTGLCTSLALQIQYGGIAPGGGWAVVITAVGRGANTSLVRVHDLQVGRWRPVSLGAQRLPLFWDTATSLIVAAPRGNALRYLRCDTRAQCTPITMPRVAAGSLPPSLIPRFG
jgi:hypothetical protein